MKSFFAFAHRLGAIPFDVGRPLRMPAHKDALSERILTEEEVGRLIDAAKATRDRLIVETLYYCALRVSELTSLLWSDLSRRLDGGQLTVMGKGGKTRSVLIPPGLFDDLVRFGGADPANFVFDVSISQVGRIVHAVAKTAGIGKPVSPHWLRHCHASHALDRGAPLSLVQATLGHGNVATTSRYLHARPDRGSSSFLRRFQAPDVVTGG